MAHTSSARSRLEQASSAIRAWIRTNIIGPPEYAAYSLRKPSEQQVDEQLKTQMEETGAVPPSALDSVGNVNPEAIHYLAHFLVDAFFGAIAAAVAWLFFHFTHLHLHSEEWEHRSEIAERLGPPITWLVCFLQLAIRRRRKKSAWIRQ